MENKEERTISQYEHENALMHYGMVNRRSFLALFTVCLTFIVITLIFVLSYTARERKWTAIIEGILTPPAITEVQSGIYEQPYQ